MPESKSRTEDLVKGMFACDAVRIYRALDGKQFLILGWNRNTATDSDTGQWYKNGQAIDFNYLEEKVIASGYSVDELMASAREYKRISALTMEEYLKELPHA